MPIITLISDFGDKDWYAGALKGALLTAAPDAALIDISHSIAPFEMVQAALVARNTWQEFPAGTIHVLAVNCVYGPDIQFLVAAHKGHFFIAPNNGVLSLLFGPEMPATLRVLPAGEEHFAVKPVVSTAAHHICQGLPLEDLGEPATDIVEERIGLRPVMNNDQIRGTVIHIDHFENVVLNIDRELFENAGKSRPFLLYFKRNDPVSELSINYSDVPLGEPLCLFNSAGLLEIAVNFGKAATLFGLKKEDVVEVIFTPQSETTG